MASRPSTKRWARGIARYLYASHLSGRSRLRHGGDDLCASGDNWMLHVAAEMLKPGDVAVLGTSSENTDGMFGDLLATSFRARRRRGPGDRRRLPRHRRAARHGISRVVEGRSCQRHGEGHHRVGQYAHHLRRGSGPSGDVVVADDDGVVIVPRLQAAKVAAAAAAREAKEAGTRRRLAAGELGLDVYGMREPLAKAGLRYFEDEAALQRELQK